MKLDSLKSRFTDESIYKAMETNLGDYIESLEEITSEIPIVDKSIKPIITCLKNAIKVYLKVSGAEEKALSKEESDYLTSCFVQNVEAFKDGIMPVLQVEYDEKIVSHLIDVIDVESLYEAKVNLIDFYKDPVGSTINAKISQAVVSIFGTIMPEYNQNFLYDVWNDSILNTAEKLLNDEFFMCRDKIRNYVVFNESSEAKKMHDLRLKHHKEIMALEEQKVFEEENATVKNLYCPVDVEIRYETQELSPLDIFKNKQVMEDRKDCIREDFFALNEWLHDKKCNTAVLSGEPGYGKSTVLINFAARLSEKGYLVFFINIGDIKIHDVENLYTDIIEALKEYDYFKYVYSKSQETYINQIGEINDAVFILDGLDEVAYGDFDEVIKNFIRAFLVDFGMHYKIILSGRKNLIDMILYELGNIRILEILALDNKYCDRREKFWDKYCEVLKVDDSKINILYNVERNMLEIPLILYLLAWVAKENDDIRLKNKASLFELIIFTVYAKSYDREKVTKNNIYNSDEYASYMKKLEIVGTTCFLSGENKISYERCIEYAKLMNIYSAFSEFLESEEIFASVLLRNFYFKKSPDGIYFAHKTFCEFLFAKELIFIIFTRAFPFNDFLTFELKYYSYSYEQIQIFINDKYNDFTECEKSIFINRVQNLFELYFRFNDSYNAKCKERKTEQITTMKNLYSFDFFNIDRQSISYLKSKNLEFIGNLWLFLSKIFYIKDIRFILQSNLRLDVLDLCLFETLERLDFKGFSINYLGQEIGECSFINCKIVLHRIYEQFDLYGIEKSYFRIYKTRFISNSYIIMREECAFFNNCMFCNTIIELNIGKIVIENCALENCDLTLFVVNKVIEIGSSETSLKNCYVYDEDEKAYYFTGTFSDLKFNHGFIKDYIITYNKEHGEEG